MQTNLVSNVIEDRHHVAHMVDREDGIEDLALIAVVVAYG